MHICLFILIWVLQLWLADLTVPFSCRGDGLLVQMWTKTLVDNRWYLHNDYVGMPTGLDMHQCLYCVHCVIRGGTRVRSPSASLPAVRDIEDAA
jgi:hypothetical protein